MTAMQTILQATVPYFSVGFQLEELFLVIYPAEPFVGIHLVEHYPDQFNRGAWWSSRHHYRNGRKQ